MAEKQLLASEAPMRDQVLPTYETPTVVTYTDEEVLEALGPAQAATSISPRF